MNNIPPKLRKQLADDPMYKRCIVHQCYHGPGVKIEWHHNLIFAGKQVQERWCILPICKAVHDLANNTLVRGHLDWIMINRATDDELRRYSKAIDLIAKRNRLNKQYGVYEKYTNKNHKG